MRFFLSAAVFASNVLLSAFVYYFCSMCGNCLSALLFATVFVAVIVLLILILIRSVTCG